MTAQVALYPDSLLAQLFMATTYPDEFAAAMTWSKAHPDAKGDDAVKMVENEPWDPAVASMVGFPEVLITLGEKPDWVKNMGDAFLAQPEAVMDSVQRLRAQAQKAGNLKSNEQVKVSTQAAEAAPAAAPQTVVVQQSAPPPQVIVIEPAQPSVVYVPAYNPTVVYGAWPYPAYPPYYYPPPPGYWWSRTIATGIAWGVGIGVSNALWGGFGWGRHDVDINVNRYNNINVNRRIDVNSSRTTWNHNTEHRGSTAYRGGNATKQSLDKKYQSGNREQFRGKDASRDASRDRASQTMADRGVADKSAARDKAQAADKSAARDKAQGADKCGRPATRRSRLADKSAVATRPRRGQVGSARQGAERRSRCRETARADGRSRQRSEGREQHAGAGAGRPRRARSQQGCGATFRAVAQAVPRLVAPEAAANLQPGVAGVVRVAVVVAVAAVVPAAAVDAKVETERDQHDQHQAHPEHRRHGRHRSPWHRSRSRRSAYPTPEAAADALVDGIARNDGDAIKAVVGADYRKYIPAESIDPEDITNFLEAWAKAHAIVTAGADKAFLGVGKNGWTLPIPIVKTAAGWRFDTKAAPDEMRIRRIGRNELAAIQVALAYTDAQDEYHARDWNGDGVLEYASAGCRRRASTTDCTGRRSQANRRARSAPNSRMRRSASRTTAICTRSSRRRVRTRPVAPRATSRTAT